MVQARAEGERKSRLAPKVAGDRCIGCGVCAAACRRGAMKMKPRTKRPVVPRTIMERTLRMAIERGHLPHFVFDQGAGRGARFMNHVLQGLCALPAAQRVLASEQLKSRFVRFALGAVKDPTGGA
jgi:ferredoxin